MEGSAKTYYENGTVREERTYKNDKREGPNKGYYEGGQLQSEGTLRDGQPEGN
ncbi:MAG: hypothetical protein HY591_06860 [Candidatus Omnitrophica bacterium]|nr:hypothetical protein [Candidatus Omnitrophota bacterium]